MSSRSKAQLITPLSLLCYSRFLRRPNIGEVAAQFRQLAASQQRESEGSSLGGTVAHAPYAAFCALAVARCEQAMQHQTAEAEALLEAGQCLRWKQDKERRAQAHPLSHLPLTAHSFVAAEASEQLLSGDGFKHNIIDAVHCYELAAEVRNARLEF